MSTIMEFCTPPIPGETHKYYGDAHNNFIRLPQFNPTAMAPVAPKMKKRTTEQKTLHDLAAVGNLILLKQILLLLPDPLKAVNEAQSSTGFTPLHYAAARGHLKIVECLVDEYSVSVDARDKEGEVRRLTESSHQACLLT
jgi:ankyrin repeat protein